MTDSASAKHRSGPGWSLAAFKTIVLVLVVSHVGRVGWATESIRYSSADTKQVRERAGAITDYADGVFEFAVEGGGILRVPASRVISIDFEGDEKYTQGKKALAEGRWEEAFPLLADGYRAESRTWAKFEIQALLIRVLYALEKASLACQGYLQLIDDDPNTRHFHLIPLAWLSGSDDPAFVSEAEQWLESSNQLRQLLGASWMLTTSKQPQALELLGQLAQSSNSQIRQLALTQVWRGQVLKAGDDQVGQWEKSLADVDLPLRSGGQFLVAKAGARLSPGDKTSLNYLKVAFDPAAFELLRAEALLGAIQQLADSSPEDAVRLAEELERRYPESKAWRLGRVLVKDLR